MEAETKHYTVGTKVVIIQEAVYTLLRGEDIQQYEVEYITVGSRVQKTGKCQVSYGLSKYSKYRRSTSLEDKEMCESTEQHVCTMDHLVVELAKLQNKVEESNAN